MPVYTSIWRYQNEKSLNLIQKPLYAQSISKSTAVCFCQSLCLFSFPDLLHFLQKPVKATTFKNTSNNYSLAYFDYLVHAELKHPILFSVRDFQHNPERLILIQKNGITLACSEEDKKFFQELFFFTSFFPSCIIIPCFISCADLSKNRVGINMFPNSDCQELCFDILNYKVEL